MKTVWYYSHPADKWAKVNPKIFATAQEKLDAEFINLDTLYADKPIDMKAEEERILAADTIVFQYPVYFLGIVPKIAELSFGVFSKHSKFAYAKGDLMKNKQIILVNSCLGGAKSEDHALSPSFAAWAGLAKQILMKTPKQFILGGVQKIDDEKIECFVDSLVAELNSSE